MDKLLAYWLEDGVEVAFFIDGYSARMTINGGLQFDEKDEYRYHQSLFLLPALCLDPNKKNKVLVLGGGDGLGTRELLRLKHIDKIDLVDISPFIVNLAKTHPKLVEMNMGAFHNPRVNIIIGDGYEYVKNTKEKYDLVILDYPDPSINEKSPVNKLFTEKHYKDISKILADKDSLIVIQSTSVRISPNVFNYIKTLISKIYTTTLPLRINIDSFGDIGIIIASMSDDIKLKNPVPEGTFFSEESIEEMLIFHEDEIPDIEGEKLLEMPIWDIIKYDLNLRKEEIRRYMKEVYKKQIEEATNGRD